MDDASHRMEKFLKLVPKWWRWSLTLLIAGVAINIHAVVIYWPSPGLDLAKQRLPRVQCVNNLKQIGLAAGAWSYDNADQFPQDFITFTNEMVSPAMLFCPEDANRPAPTNWNNYDWAHIDYKWIPQAGWYDPAAIDCQCRIHDTDLFVGGHVHSAGGYRAGWPAIIAGPMAREVTPGSDVQFDVRIAPNATQPVTYQWRREQLYYVTNIVFIDDPDDPNGGYWQTNRTSKFTVTNINGATNSFYTIRDTQTSDSDYYSVTASNIMGTTVSAQANLTVDPTVSSRVSDEYWSAINCINNLKQIALLGRIWSADRNDHMPESLSVMTNAYGTPVFGWPTVLFCRSDKNHTAPSDWPGLNLANTSYEIFPGNIEDSTAVFCRCKVHGFYANMDGEVISKPYFARMRRLANNTTELNLILLSTETHILEVSSDLANWTTLRNYSATNGSFLFYETNDLPQRFYRLRIP